MMHRQNVGLKTAGLGLAIALGAAVGWANALPATGGDHVYTNTVGGKDYAVLVFTTPGTNYFTNTLAMSADILIVAGGGGGGGTDESENWGRGAGGGGGGLIFLPGLAISSTGSHTIVVGAGGAGTSSGGQTSSLQGENGADSSAFSLTALGGGGGGVRNSAANDGLDGGSGGGGSKNGSASEGGEGLQPLQPGASGSYGWGNDGAGGAGGYGGGGGAGKASTNYNGGDGLSGVTIGEDTYSFAELFSTNYGEIISEEAWFAGGGSTEDNTGGKGGGGDGTDGAKNGTAHTGGGGAGRSNNGSESTSGGDGGSGIVMIRYEIVDMDLPVILSLGATGVIANAATLNGTLSSTGATQTAVSVLWEQTDTDQGTNTSAWANTNDFGAYSPALGELPYDYATNITGLAENTIYTYRYWATNGAGETWGDAMSFMTWGPPSAPMMNAPSQTGFVHVVISGAVNDGNPDPLAYFCLNAGEDGPSGTTSGWDVVESAGTQSGVFTNKITGLVDDTLYYARVYVTNEVGAAWSDPVSFTTRPPPAQLTLSADDQVDGVAPELVFDETPNISLAGTGASPANWTFDFAYYGGDPVPVILDTNKLYCGLTGRDDTGTLYFDLNGGSLSGNHDTNAIVTYRGTSRDSANVNIVNVGDVDIGAIDARAGRTSWANASQTIYPGYIQIGTESNRAGNIRADYLYAFSFSGDDPNAERGYRNVTLYGSGNVTIPGDVRTDTQGGSAGHVLIDHQGALTTGAINADTRGYGVNYPYPGNVTLNGGDSSGDASVDGIQASLTSGKGNDTSTRRVIAISNYHHVVVGSILARYEGDAGNGTFYGSNVKIERNISGDITINGQIDIRSYKDHNHSGYLKLACTGTVTLAELDLDKVLYASLDSGSGASEITGAIADFDVSGATGTGAEADPKVSAETRLRAPNGQTVYYEYQPGTLNNSLGGYAWQLKDLDGTSDGGLLMVEPPSGTVITIR